MEINREKVFLHKQENFWHLILYKLFRNSQVGKAKWYLKSVWSYVKLKYIVVPNVTGNVKPFKKHSIALQEINDVHYSLNTHTGQFYLYFHSWTFICQHRDTTTSGTCPTKNHLFVKHSPPASAMKDTTGSCWEGFGETLSSPAWDLLSDALRSCRSPLWATQGSWA